MRKPWAPSPLVWCPWRQSVTRGSRSTGSTTGHRPIRNIRRAQAIEANKLHATLAQHTHPLNNPRSTGALRLVHMGDNDIPILGARDPAGHRLGRQGGAGVGVEAISGDQKTPSLDRLEGRRAVEAGGRAIPSGRRAGQTLDIGRPVQDFPLDGRQVAGALNAKDPPVAERDAREESPRPPDGASSRRRLRRSSPERPYRPGPWRSGRRSRPDTRPASRRPSLRSKAWSSAACLAR